MFFFFFKEAILCQGNLISLHDKSSPLISRFIYIKKLKGNLFVFQTSTLKLNVMHLVQL